MTALERDDIQGNVLRGYDFPFARYLVARVRADGAAPRPRAAGWPARPTRSRPRPSGPAAAPAPATSRSPTRALRRLEPPRLAGSRASRDEFRAGMAARADRLGDAGGGAPEHWDDGTARGRDPRPRHALGRRPDDALARALRRACRRDMAAHGLEPGYVQEAAASSATTASTSASPTASASRRSPGSRATTIARPGRRRSAAVRGTACRPDIVPRATDRRLAWRALRAGRVRARLRRRGRRPAARARRRRFDRNGTFMVWRKLRQDVAGFRAFLADAAAQHRPRAPASSPRRSSGAGRTAARSSCGPRTATRALGQRPRARQRLRLRATTRPASRARAAPTSAARTRATRCARAAGSRPAIASCAAACPTARRWRRAPRTTAPTAASSSSPCRRASSASSRSSRRAGSTTATRSASAGRPTRSRGRSATPARQACSADARHATPRRCARSSRRRGGEYLFVPGVAALRALGDL